MKLLEEVFRKFNDLKVLVLGDVMIDSYVWGEVSRISPEAPVPVVNVKNREERLGGAANVALNLQELGVKPILCSVIGDDPESSNFFQLLEHKGLFHEGIIKSPKRRTTIKHRVIAGSQHLLRVDSESFHDLEPGEEDEFLRKVVPLIIEADAIIFEDYDKGVLTSKVIKSVVDLARNTGILTAVDPKKRNFLSYQGVTLFKPNKKEMYEGLGIEFEPDSLDQLNSSAQLLKERLKHDVTLLTLSEHGIFVHHPKGSSRLKAHKREISDVSGAGDTVISIAAASMALGMPPEFCADLANLGGGLVCEHTGVVPINKVRLFEEAKKSMPLASYGLEG